MFQKGGGCFGVTTVHPAAHVTQASCCSTWPAATRPASLASSASGFRAPHPDRHWGAMACRASFRQPWLSPPGTCQTLAGGGLGEELERQNQRWAGLEG